MHDAIRLARPDDVAAIKQLVDDAFGKYIVRLERPPAPMVDDYAKRVAARSTFVLTDAGMIVGVMVLSPEADHLEVETIATAPARQGEKIGKRLLAFAASEARRRGLDELRLSTNVVMHESLAAYLHLGWQEYARGPQAGHQRIFLRKRLSG